MAGNNMIAPFPWFGGKRTIAEVVWSRLGSPKQYIEPFCGSAGMGVQAIGQIPHISDAGRGELLTSAGRTAFRWLRELADRLERVRIIHGSWDRCLNHHFGGSNTAVFLDPPYKRFESLYCSKPVAEEVEIWARDNAGLRIALCGHLGDYDLPGWDCVQWKRTRFTYGSAKTTDKEAVWFSPACLGRSQLSLLGGVR